MHKAVYKYVILLGDKYDELERDAHETEYEEVLTVFVVLWVSRLFFTVQLK